MPSCGTLFLFLLCIAFHAVTPYRAHRKVTLHNSNNKLGILPKGNDAPGSGQLLDTKVAALESSMITNTRLPLTYRTHTYRRRSSFADRV